MCSLNCALDFTIHVPRPGGPRQCSTRQRSVACTRPDAFFEVVGHLGEDSAVIVEHLPPDQALAAIAYVKQAAEQRGFTFG
jgi:hypothetical protein